MARAKSATSISDPRRKNSTKITSPSTGTTTCFKGVQNQFAKQKPVRIFVMGANTGAMKTTGRSPVRKATKYFLHSAGKANSLRGDGLFPPRRHERKPPIITFTIRRTRCPPSAARCVAIPPISSPGRATNGRRNRAMTFWSIRLPLSPGHEVTGPVTLELYASSSAVDTDFTAKLVDVGPDGFAQNLTEGIIRARYRDSQETPTLLNPGEAYKFNIDLWSTSNVFRKGHMLRLEVSSSNFPRFDRNMNTGEDQATAQKSLPATNTIYHDAAHPSALVLPLVAP